MKGKTHKEAAAIREQMKVYKSNNHSVKEVAEKFNISEGYAQQICKGICPQNERRPVNLRNQYTDGNFDRIANCKMILSRANPNFEYAGGFIDVDSPVDIRCKVCGNIFSRSLVGLRHYNKKHDCPYCLAEQRKVEKEKQKEEKEEQRLQKIKKSRLDRMNKMLAKSQVQTSMKQCPVCNALFIGSRTYCSDSCSRKASYTISKDKRVRRMKEAIVDRNITLEELYKRSNGKCSLCGELCDYNDCYYRGKVFIAGENYPSIDHVIPLSKGGKHSWDNVQLAHRRCNTVKSNSLYPPIKKIV